MFKGITKIEFTDVNTGKKEVVEKNNMFTNGLSYLLGGISHVNDTYLDNSNVNILPIIENLIGGILIFDSQLDENVENIYPPSSGMTGCANTSINDVANLTKRGSYNANESGFNADGSYTFTWDFSTTQANGQIASVALVPACAGINGIDMVSTSRHGYQLDKVNKLVTTGSGFSNYSSINRAKSVGDYLAWNECLKHQKKESEETLDIELTLTRYNTLAHIIKYIDYDNNILHGAHVESRDGNLVFFDYDIELSYNKIGLNEYRYQMRGFKNIRSKVLTTYSSTGFFGTVASYYDIGIVNIDGDRYLIDRITSSTNPNASEAGCIGSTLHKIMIVNMNTKEIEQQFEKTLPYMNNSNGRPYLNFVDSNKLLFNGLRKYSNIDGTWTSTHYALLVDFNDFNDVKELYATDGTSVLNETTTTFNLPTTEILKNRFFIPIAENGYQMYLQKYNDEYTLYRVITSYSTPILSPKNTAAYVCRTLDIKDKVIARMLTLGTENYFNYIEEIFGLVLITINNLENVVEKTADKTMKIIYTIREVD